METSKEARLISHELMSMANILRLVAKKHPASADGFEEFQVRGSALRHIGVSVDYMADQLELAAQAFLEDIPSAGAANMELVSSLFKGCGFQLKHFGLSLKSDHHHMVPMCGAHNPRSPIAESGFLWEGVSKVAKSIAEHSKQIDQDLSNSFNMAADELATFADSIAQYRQAMEESEFAKAAMLLSDASEVLANVSVAVDNIVPQMRKL